MSASELLFQLANADRLTILSEIDKESLKLSQIARKLSATVQETSRHLERLSEAKLIERDSTSAYHITSFGKLVLSFLPSIAFLRENRVFFLSHDLSSLPPGFIQRIGELTGCDYISQLDEALAHAEGVVKGAEEYVWLMADQLVRQSYPHEHPKSVSFRLILPTSIETEALQRIKNKIGGGLEIGIIDDARVTIVMNEKIAGVYFPNSGGRMDLSQGFTGKTRGFHKWCEDLYNFYWNNANKTLDLI
jgi:predicted transcriptional regulator